MTQQLRLILVGGGVQELRQAARLAQEAGAQVRLADHRGEAIDFAREHGADLLLADIGCDVPALIHGLRVERIGIPVLACGVDAPAPAAVAAVRSGAIDFLPLPPSRELIAAALLTIGDRRTDLVGCDPAWRSALATGERLAAARTPILITGPSGCGKQALARRLHAHSGRLGPLVMLDGAAQASEEALASELLGHREGAFEGALADRKGKLAEAGGGTLLVRLAEGLPPALQQSLAMAVRHNGPRLIVTCAARTSLHPQLGTVLSLLEIALPALSARAGDIPALARLFAARIAAEEGLPAPRFASSALQGLVGHHWPGNVAELEHVVQRAVLLAGSAPIGPGDLVLGDARGVGGQEPAVADLLGRSIEEVERAMILGTLDRCSGNRTSASAILGISVRTMRNKLRTFAGEGYRIAPAA